MNNYEDYNFYFKISPDKLRLCLRDFINYEPIFILINKIIITSLKEDNDLFFYDYDFGFYIFNKETVNIIKILKYEEFKNIIDTFNTYYVNKLNFEDIDKYLDDIVEYSHVLIENNLNLIVDKKILNGKI